ncbi:carbohydrate ABC transporter permease [Paenibacillus sp. GCM10012303]|uniref:carbohydrate ABC transporter permease n=1 Tax=Paenibacillus sp. GCM10012303 TaxID=3317340 RepID=UPI003615379C
MPAAAKTTTKTTKIRRTHSDLAFQIVNYTLISAFTFICLFPFLNTFASAFSDNHAIQSGKVVFFPVGFTLDPMKAVFMDHSIIRALYITIFVTIVGTAAQMIFTILTAYPLSRRDLKYRAQMMNYILITMLFSGGLIPGYLLIKNLGMLNSLYAIIVPGLLSSFNLIVLRTFFQGLPDELREAAVMDGCSNIRYIITCVVPLSIPAIATLSLFYAVGHWNSYFGPLLFIDNPDLHTLQVKLRAILLLSQHTVNINELTQQNALHLMEESLKSATIVFATVPILLVYPFLQKYFVKGVMIGAVKG